MPKKNIKAKRILIVIISVLVIAATVFVVLMLVNRKSNKKNEVNEVENNQIVEKDIEQKVYKKSDEAERKKQGGITVIEDDDPNNSDTVTGLITRASAISDDIFRIVIKFDQALSSGQCELSFVNGSTEIYASAEVVAHPNSASCSFDLDRTKIFTGKWAATIKVATSKDRTGIIKGEVEVK